MAGRCSGQAVDTNGALGGVELAVELKRTARVEVSALSRELVVGQFGAVGRGFAEIARLWKGRR